MFHSDNKYIKENKCSEKKLFYIDCEEEEDLKPEQSQKVDLEDTTPTISCHAFAGITFLKLLG